MMASTTTAKRAAVEEASSGSCVYVLAAGDGLYKVGCTARPLRRRVAELNAGARTPLTVAASVPVPAQHLRGCEAYAHAALADLAAPEAGGTEFFRGDDAAEVIHRVEAACRDFVATADAVRREVDALPPDDDTAADSAAPLFDERRRFAAQLRTVQLRLRLLEAALLDRFREPISRRDGRPLLRWRERTQTRFDLAAFRTAHPDLASAFAEEQTARTLTFC